MRCRECDPRPAMRPAGITPSWQEQCDSGQISRDGSGQSGSEWSGHRKEEPSVGLSGCGRKGLVLSCCHGMQPGFSCRECQVSEALLEQRLCIVLDDTKALPMILCASEPNQRPDVTAVRMTQRLMSLAKAWNPNGTSRRSGRKSIIREPSSRLKCQLITPSHLTFLTLLHVRDLLSPFPF